LGILLRGISGRRPGSSPPLCCGFCAWTQTARPTKKAAAMIDFNNRFEQGPGCPVSAERSCARGYPRNVNKAMSSERFRAAYSLLQNFDASPQVEGMPSYRKFLYECLARLYVV